MTGLHGPPVVRQLALIVALFLLIVGAMFVVFNVQIGVLWAMRAYVGGEGLWSKGQKDAVHHLVRYATTRDQQDYDAFLLAIEVPLKDREARLELEKESPDLERARAAFIAARNHPDDADGMVSLFRRFRNVPEMAEAIRIWTDGDRSIDKLRRYGAALHRELATPRPDDRRIATLLSKIDRVNTRVTPLEDAFSQTLGVGSRRIRWLSILATVAAAACLLLFAIGASWLILRDARRAELALRASEGRYRGLFEDANDVVYVHDLTGRFLDVNKAAERVIGYSRAEAAKLELPDVVAPESLALAREHIERKVREGGTSVYEITIVSKDGRRIPLEVSTRLIEESGEPVAVQGIARDITERRRAEEERRGMLERERAARAEAELGSRTKDEFLALLSHELRTPLTAILAWARLLRGGRLDDVARVRALDVIERNTRLQTALIDDLLDVSRIIAGKIRLDHGPVDAAAAVGSAVDALRGAAEAKGLELVLRITPDVGTIWGDRNRLQQVVSNLLANAIKFTPSGRVEVGVRRDRGDAYIWVRDAGVGIAPSFLPHVFERFRQADSTYTRRHGGLGLGLAIVRHLVELHGGTVTAESAGQGQGATFTVRLPLIAEEVVPALAKPERLPDDAASPLLRGIDVLVVDDDAETREALRAALESRGARVRLACSAPDAIDALEQGLPDVLLCDVAMPGESGFDLMRSIRAREPERGGEIPAAALTAFARVEDGERALAAGFQRHLVKPMEPLDLAYAVAELAASAADGITRRRA